MEPPPASPSAATAATDPHNSTSSRFPRHESTTSKLSQTKDGPPVSDLWTDGLICAFEYVPGDLLKRSSPPHRHPLRTIPKSPNHSIPSSNGTESPMPIPIQNPQDQVSKSKPYHERKWIPIGWSRIAQLVEKVQPDVNRAEQQMEFSEDEDDYTVADLAAPYWERPVGPTWWCHVAANHPSVDAWLANAQWLHPAIATALRDENRLISDRMKHLLYEPFRSQ